MDSAKTVTANFEEIPSYVLTMGVAPTEGGTTSPAVGAHSYNEGEEVSITATANTGYRFVSWSGGVLDPNSSSTSVVMDSAKTVTANFEETGLEPEPTFISLIPADHASSVDVAANFTLTVGDGDGYENISKVQFVIKDGIGTKIEEDSIGLEYYRWDGKIFVRMYNWSTGRWSRGVPSSDIVIENDLCSLDVSQTTVEGDEGFLTINWNITPKATFIGMKRIWIRLTDFDGHRTDSMEVGSWNVDQ